MSWQSFDAEQLRTNGLHQLYELGLARDFSDRFRLDLHLRGEGNDSGSQFLGEERSLRFRELEPRARVLYTLENLQIASEWDRIESRSMNEEGSSGDRSLERLTAQVSYRPEGLPSLGADGERRHVTDPGGGVNLSEDRAAVHADYSLGGLQLSGMRQRMTTEDLGRGYHRTSDDLQGQLTYARSFWSNRLSIDAQQLLTHTHLEETALKGAAVTVPNPIFIARAYQAVDPTPDDDRDQPLALAPALVDGNLAQPAGVPLGPLAPTSRNLALDFGRFAQVDELRILARDAAGRPLSTGGAVRWDLYTSDDLVTWRPIVAGVQTTFDPAQGLWSVTFPELTVRYLKVVSFFVNTIPTEVTEVQAFFSSVVAPGRHLDTDLRYATTQGFVSVRPLHTLTLSWNGLFNDSSQDPDVGDTLVTRDRDQVGTAIWAPRRWASLELLHEERRVQTEQGSGGAEQRYTSSSGIFRLFPTSRLSTNLEYDSIQSDLEAGRVDTTRLFLRTVARFWDLLEVDFDIGRERQELVLLGYTVDSPTVNLNVRAQLTRSFYWGVNASMQRNDVSGRLPLGLLLPERETRWRTEIYWRPSAQLGISAAVGKSIRRLDSGLLQSYSVQWDPFPGGAVHLSGKYDEDVDPLVERRTRRLLFAPTWTLNPHLSLNLSYYYLTTHDVFQQQTTKNAFVALDATF